MYFFVQPVDSKTARMAH